MEEARKRTQLELVIRDPGTLVTQERSWQSQATCKGPLGGRQEHALDVKSLAGKESQLRWLEKEKVFWGQLFETHSVLGGRSRWLQSGGQWGGASIAEGKEVIEAAIGGQVEEIYPPFSDDVNEWERDVALQREKDWEELLGRWEQVRVEEEILRQEQRRLGILRDAQDAALVKVQGIIREEI